MPDNAVSTSSNASPEKLEEAMWRLKVQDDQEGLDANQNPYPDRPGEPDCIYYMKTGLCGYGNNCRYNHPNIGQGTLDRGELPERVGQPDCQGTLDRGELPERVGQPDCQFFLKTGTCKFGATCKYHHPRDRHDAQPVTLNALGLPMRQDEKSCPFYMRTGTCKFGMLCKFNHPQPSTMGSAFPVTGPSIYGSTGSSVAPSSTLPLIGGLSAWPLARPPYLSSPRVQNLPAYMPVILPPSQGTMPVQQGWSTYTGTVGHVPSTDVIGPNHITNSKLHAQSSFGTTMNLPERPDQPECQYYMKTGGCKYGTTCKYHHPKERNSQANFTLGPLGLPLRPDQAVCTFYSMYGSCRYGSACKFDHPLVGYYNYTLPTLPVVEPLALYTPNQRNPPQVTWPSAPESTFPSKTWTSPDQPMASDEKKSYHTRQNSGDKNNGKSEHDANPPAPTSSPPLDTAPSSELAQNHSD